MGAVEGAGRVLIVDDDPSILALVEDCLVGEGYDVTTAPDFVTALAALARARFDVVLSDALREAGTGPLGDRWTRLDHIREAAGATPVIIFSAHRAGTFDGFRARGFSDYLAKPFDLDELIASVRRAVARGRDGAERATD